MSSILQDVFDAAFAEAKAAQEVKQTKPPRTQRQALGEAMIELQRATLTVGDIILNETGEDLQQSFSDADLAYAGGYLGGLSAIVSRLSHFVRNYPAA